MAMKNITKITVAAFLLFCISGCVNLDYYPDNAITQEQIKSSVEGAEYATVGNYSLFKDYLMFRNNANEAKNTYIRHYFQATEFKSDNIAIDQYSSDALYDLIAYRQTPDNTPTSYLWYVMYKVAISTSGVIEVLQDGTSPNIDNLKGENLFLRALSHLHLVTLFAQPYARGRDNLGVIIRISADVKETKRATVGETYDQIVSDLKNAARLMTLDKGAGYASKAAALGLLSRVYLYMEDYDNAIQAADDCLALRPAGNLEPNATLSTYFANALTSKETLFAVACTDIDDRVGASIGSMYLKEGGGWGEIYASQPLRDLLNQYPNDARTGFIKPNYTNGNTLPTANNATATFDYTSEGVADESGAGELRIVSKQATVYYYNGNFYAAQNGGGNQVIDLGNGKHKLMISGIDEEGYLVPDMEASVRLAGLLKYYVTKFSYQNGRATLSSPVMLRLAEVLLNRAEAKYKKNNDVSGALSDLNLIRQRAGIPNMGAGITLDSILDERRRELYLEGHRAFDLVRNNKSIDRRYAGDHPPVMIEPENPRNVYYIPNMEIEASGIPQNP
ncbi:membrane protein [Bacteroidia bacterium]|nr:membrane protein [Bacteroidia bacterium]